MEYKLTFIVPAFNSELHIKETLDCLVSQTIAKSCQIIVVNDGSTDSTKEIVTEFCLNHPNVTCINQPNSGVSSARNAGIEAAKGKYLMFVDSDDLLDSDCAEKMYLSMEKAGADMAVCRLTSFGFGNNISNPIADKLSRKALIDIYDQDLLWNFLPMNKCYRTSTLQNGKARFPSLSYSEDAYFMMAFIFENRPIITGCNATAAHYRRHDPSKSLSTSQRISVPLLKDFYSAHEYIYSLAKGSSFPEKEEYLQEIIYKTYYSSLNEFYRLIWFADNESISLLEEKCKCLRAAMSSKTLSKLTSDNNRDLGTPVFSKKEITDNPFISILVHNPSDQFLISLYYQSFPYFEVITCALPENSVFKNFDNIQNNRPKAKIKITLKGSAPLNPRLIRLIVLLKNRFPFIPSNLLTPIANISIKLKSNISC